MKEEITFKESLSLSNHLQTHRQYFFVESDDKTAEEWMTNSTRPKNYIVEISAHKMRRLGEQSIVIFKVFHASML